VDACWRSIILTVSTSGLTKLRSLSLENTKITGYRNSLSPFVALATTAPDDERE
jgi:hypothetical protein